MEIVKNSFDEVYISIAQFLLSMGRRVVVRGREIMELKEPLFFQVLNPRTRGVRNPARRFRIGFAFGEFFWILFHYNDLKRISYFASNYRDYSDDGVVLRGAYGPRLQWEKVVELLKKDKTSRRVVLDIYNDKIDLGVDSKDIPCTLTLDFLLRDEKLDLLVSMRSSDLFLGILYDFFNFSLLQEYIASLLGCKLGKTSFILASSHFYLDDIEKIKSISVVSIPEQWSQFEMPVCALNNLESLKEVYNIVSQETFKNYSLRLNKTNELLKNWTNFERMIIDLLNFLVHRKGLKEKLITITELDTFQKFISKRNPYLEPFLEFYRKR